MRYCTAEAFEFAAPGLSSEGLDGQVVGAYSSAMHRAVRGASRTKPVDTQARIRLPSCVYSIFEKRSQVRMTWKEATIQEPTGNTDPFFV
jgi:hypothetical protein